MIEIKWKCEVTYSHIVYSLVMRPNGEISINFKQIFIVSICLRLFSTRSKFCHYSWLVYLVAGYTVVIICTSFVLIVFYYLISYLNISPSL